MFASIPTPKKFSNRNEHYLRWIAGHNHFRKSAKETRFSLRVAGAFSHSAHAVRQWGQKGEPPLQ
jgi:hypothetical protein